MEADSTTRDSNTKPNIKEDVPFLTSPTNLKLYMELTYYSGEKSLESQIVERLQGFGLLPTSIDCPTSKPNCKNECKAARVIDRVQWCCMGCGKKQPIRSGSFFMRLQCSLLQALQMMLAWSEDVDCAEACEHFGMKIRVGGIIYDKLDELAARAQEKIVLGGEGSIVLAEMYPDCLNRLSPDTTDQTHVHKILMLADTKHVPTAYKLHVIRDDTKKQPGIIDNKRLEAEVAGVVVKSIKSGPLVRGVSSPPLPDAVPFSRLAEQCDADMHHFLSTRIWRQAVTLCNASRDLCGNSGDCAAAVQKYLDVALWRTRQRHMYESVLQVIATEYSDCVTNDILYK